MGHGNTNSDAQLARWPISLKAFGVILLMHCPTPVGKGYTRPDGAMIRPRGCRVPRTRAADGGDCQHWRSFFVWPNAERSKTG